MKETNETSNYSFPNKLQVPDDLITGGAGESPTLDAQVQWKLDESGVAQYRLSTHTKVTIVCVILRDGDVSIVWREDKIEDSESVCEHYIKAFLKALQDDYNAFLGKDPHVNLPEECFTPEWAMQKPAVESPTPTEDIFPAIAVPRAWFHRIARYEGKSYQRMLVEWESKS